ncbi:MAG TPA: c-type cytochrome biogenesis protein CcmI [Burkholderiales bacterium]
MITFWLIGAALAVAALAYVLRPLLRGKGGVLLSRREANVSIYRDQLRELEADLASGAVSKADYERSRVELEARLLEDVTAADTAVTRPGGRKAALALALAVPLVALAVYYVAGDPRGLDPRALDPHQAAADAVQFEAMVERLAGKLRDNPEDAEGWKLLGRSYTALGRFDKAVGAYAKAAERSPRDAQLLADFADALAMARGGSGATALSGEPEKLIERALEIDPNNLKALALSGTVAFERQDYAKAAATWSRMLPLVAADSEDARAIQGNVDEARKLAGIAPAPLKEQGEKKQAEKKQVEKKQATKGHPGVRGTVQLAAGLKKDVKPEDTVFVFARAAEGPPAPLAVLRVKARELPLEFQLTDAMAMAPGMTVSAFPRIVVTARVAKSGGVQPTPGDLQGASAAVANNASGVKVLIDSVVR